MKTTSVFRWVSKCSISQLALGTLIDNLSTAVQLSQGRLLILVDEYDQPVREGLLRLIPNHGRILYEIVVKKIKSLFGSYFAFFRAVKVALEQLDCAKIMLTGTTPIGIKQMSGLTLVSLTFEEFVEKLRNDNH